jgi:hypothetical protein
MLGGADVTVKGQAISGGKKKQAQEQRQIA